MKVRTAKEGDANKIAEIHITSWQTTYRGIIDDETLDQLDFEKRRLFWHRIIVEAKSIVLVAELDKVGIVGFISGDKAFENDDEILKPFDAELYAIYILDKHQRKGIGRLLVRSLLEKLTTRGFSRLVLWVLTDNTKACHFYDRLGGEILMHKPTHIGEQLLSETAYGWTNFASLLKL